tara:strand:- start:5934 stop:6923 length:990 start_codon:yes stop_codon:yes gene_type:complete
MGKISTYANISPVTISDKVIGTDVGGSPADQTKNFLIGDILTLFQSNITLQNVLDAGNTATQSIILSGDITQSGGAVTLGGTVKDFNGNLGNNGETLVCNASGQLVFGSGLTNQNLSQVLAIGNTATNDINLTGNLNLAGNIVQTGNITQTGDYTLTGNITMIGDPDITGDVTHSGNYLFEVGQFTFEGTSTLLLQCAVKDSTNTLGSNRQILVSDASGKVSWQNNTSNVTTSPLTTINLTLSNSEGVLVTTAATATDARIPTNAGTAFIIGTKITIIQEGAGQVTITPTAGVTLYSEGGKTKTTAQYSVAHVVKTGTDTWYAYGDITT